MSETITYSDFQDSDFESLFQMGCKLWKDTEETELRRLLTEVMERKNQRIFLAKMNNMNVGFSMFSIRTDYVEGASQSPTGYLEGIFVESDFRNKGIAREFVRLGEAWCKAQGCIQIGSDTWLTDKDSRNFHKKVGFWEEDEIVHFLKDL